MISPRTLITWSVISGQGGEAQRGEEREADGSERGTRDGEAMGPAMAQRMRGDMGVPIRADGFPDESCHSCRVMQSQCFVEWPSPLMRPVAGHDRYLSPCWEPAAR